MTLYLCLLRDSGSYLSTTPDGDANQAIELPKQAGEMLAHLLGLQSFVAAQALASLYLAGVTMGERELHSSAVPAERVASRSAPSGTRAVA